MIILASISCNRNAENCHDSVEIINNSENPIYFERSQRFPDTLTLYPNPSLDPVYRKINSHTRKNDIIRDCFETEFKLNDKGIIMYYLFDANTLETTPWDTIVKKYMILKRYDLSLQDMQNLNWTMTYP
jgi:hypothetical protein